MNKPGWKTLQFWLALAAKAVGTAIASGMVSDDRVTRLLGGASVLLSFFGYSASTDAANARDLSLKVTPPR